MTINNFFYWGKVNESVENRAPSGEYFTETSHFSHFFFQSIVSYRCKITQKINIINSFY